MGPASGSPTSRQAAAWPDSVDSGPPPQTIRDPGDAVTPVSGGRPYVAVEVEDDRIV